MLQAYHDVQDRCATGRTGKYTFPRGLKKVKISRERRSPADIVPTMPADGFIRSVPDERSNSTNSPVRARPS